MDVAGISSTLMAMSQSQTQDQISMSILKMNAQAEQALADMLTQNARQVQASSSSTESLIDLFV